MKVEQTVWKTDEVVGSTPRQRGAELVFVFGSPAAVRGDRLEKVRLAYPDAHLFGCSTAGEIQGTRILDDTLVTTAVGFDATPLRSAQVRVEGPDSSRAAGRELAGRLPAAGLAHVMVFSDGLQVNGSELVAGLTERLPAGVTVTGGLAADGDRFRETLVVSDRGATAGTIAAVGFYGSHIRVACGSLGGWDPFGPERLITRSTGNVLYELDGRPALDLYKSYLGPHAAGLPATGLLFPLNVREPSSASPVARTILAVDEKARSLTFAGDVPEGSLARLMKANLDRLIDGASGAATACHQSLAGTRPQLAILISCVGRRLVLKQRAEEEVEGVRDVLGLGTTLTGFYAYGEISPFTPTARCELHNQTMTITGFSEI